MKIATFNDIHIHKFKEFSGPLGDRRLKDILKVFIVIVNTAIEEECDVLVFSGDFFHSRRSIDVETFNMVRDTLKDLPLYKINHKIIIPGNHDWYDRKCSVTSTKFLEDFGFEVYHEPRFIEFKTEKSRIVQIHLLPWLRSFKEQVDYLEKIEHLEGIRKPKLGPKFRRLLFTHSTPKGSSTSGGFTFKNGVDFSNYEKLFDYMFCGDIHKRQYIGNLIVGGSPMHHNFGDRGQDRGFHIYDSVSNEVDFINLESYYPKFIMLEDSSVPDDTYNYYRLVVDSSKKLGEADDNVSIVLKNVVKDKNEKNIPLGASPSDALRKYAEAHGSEFDKEDLIDIGIGFI